MSCPLFEQERLRYFRAAYGPRQPARSPTPGAAPGLGNHASPSASRPAQTIIDRLRSRSRSRSPELWPGPHANASPGLALAGAAGSSGIASSTGGVGSNGIAECGGGRSKEGGSAVAERQGREGGAWEQHAKAARWSGQSSQLFEGAWVEGDESNSEEEGEDEGEEEEQGAGWGLEGVEGEGNDDEGNDEGEVQEEQGRGGAWREEEREELLTFPLGSFCVRGVETQSMWLVCNDDVLLGRSDNGLLWKVRGSSGQRQGQRVGQSEAGDNITQPLPACRPFLTSAVLPANHPPVFPSVGPLAHARLGATTGIPASVRQPTWQPLFVNTRHTQPRC